MIIPITLSLDPSSVKLPTGLARISNDEIVLIELQGALDIGDAHPTERNGKFVGKLDVDDELKRPTLLIGHHLLEGKIAPIAKTLAILHRINASAKPSGSHHDVDEANLEESMDVDEGKDDTVPPQWNIVGLVKKKIIFSKRPQPVLKRA